MPCQASAEVVVLEYGGRDFLAAHPLPAKITFPAEAKNSNNMVLQCMYERMRGWGQAAPYASASGIVKSSMKQISLLLPGGPCSSATQLCVGWEQRAAAKQMYGEAGQR